MIFIVLALYPKTCMKVDHLCLPYASIKELKKEGALQFTPTIPVAIIARVHVMFPQEL